MLIDWFTVIAQVVNFLILVWLLKHFLYQPILNAIDAREKRIASEIAEADAKKTEAVKERDEFRQKNETFDQQRSAHMNQVMEEAKTERAQLLDAARLESEDLRTRLQAALKNEQHCLNDALSLRACEEVFAIARKVLTELAGTTLEERMTEIFLARLRELNDAEMAGLKSAFLASNSPLLVRTAFELPTEQCAAIEAASKEILGSDKQLKFETAPDLISGIEIIVDGQKIAWSIAGYLASLAKSVDSLLKTPDNLQSKDEIIDIADAAQEIDENRA
ncbi:MAG: F0F1 ATP synthase subunit delta [Opitutaceae bacterium]|nr:F0F1 ATP synthase subunit delta [Opitutaceae bacterium]